jgi:hypothetical protein
MKVQIGNKIFNGKDKPIILHLSKTDKKFISEMEDDREFVIVSVLNSNDLREWLRCNTFIHKEAIQKLLLEK